jgi:four helix bundle protein
MVLNYKNLVVWQRADDLFLEVHRLTHQLFPSFERYELGSQMRRAAYSVPTNVVEGSARQSVGDKLRFFDIASASLSELTYGLHAALRLGYIDQLTYDRLDELTRRVAAPLHGLIRHNRTKKIARTVVTTATLIFAGTRLLV